MTFHTRNARYSHSSAPIPLHFTTNFDSRYFIKKHTAKVSSNNNTNQHSSPHGSPTHAHISTSTGAGKRWKSLSTLRPPMKPERQMPQPSRTTLSRSNTAHHSASTGVTSVGVTGSSSSNYFNAPERTVLDPFKDSEPICDHGCIEVPIPDAPSFTTPAELASEVGKLFQQTIGTMEHHHEPSLTAPTLTTCLLYTSPSPRDS